MNSVLVLGSMNLDHVVTVEKHPLPGETVLAESLHLFPGGKGANQAVAAARLGADVQMHGLVGDDASGRQMVDALEREGVDTSLIGVRGGVSGSAFLTVSAAGENSILVVPGANGRLAPADAAALTESITCGDLLVLQLEIPVAAAAAGVEAAKRAGARVILNAAPAMDVGNLLTLIDLLVVNESEAEFFAASPVGTLPEALRAARTIRDEYGADTIVTLGAQGAVLADSRQVCHVPGVSVPVIDTTGAGDTFVGALAALLAEGSETEAAVEFAVRAAALTCTGLGAQNSMPRRAQLSDSSMGHRSSDTRTEVEEIA